MELKQKSPHHPPLGSNSIHFGKHWPRTMIFNHQCRLIRVYWSREVGNCCSNVWLVTATPSLSIGLRRLRNVGLKHCLISN